MPAWSLRLACGTGHARSTTTIYLALELHYSGDVALARTLWLQGHPAQAVERVHEIIKSARHMDHPASLAVVLAWAASVFLWTGDLRSAEEYMDSSSTCRIPFPGALRCGWTRAQRGVGHPPGRCKDGVESLQSCLQAIHAVRYELLTTEFNISLAQGFAAIGRFAEGITLVDETIRRVETNGDDLYMPELLRVKGSLLLSKPHRCVDDAEVCFTQSLELSRRQGARAWELRTSTDLAALWVQRGRLESARELLQPVLEQFVEGSDTADVKAANSLLLTLQVGSGDR